VVKNMYRWSRTRRPSSGTRRPLRVGLRSSTRGCSSIASTTTRRVPHGLVRWGASPSSTPLWPYSTPSTRFGPSDPSRSTRGEPALPDARPPELSGRPGTLDGAWDATLSYLFPPDAAYFAARAREAAESRVWAGIHSRTKRSMWASTWVAPWDAPSSSTPSATVRANPCGATVAPKLLQCVDRGRSA
jgi:hypothetical protein